MTRAQTITTWALQLLAAAILFQTLFFKFSGAEESRFIFRTLGVEPWGRIATGVIELVAAVLLLIPRTASLGALLSVGLMAGAILSHIFKLGFAVKNDGGLLFVLAVTVFVSSTIVVWLRRHELMGWLLMPLHSGECSCSSRR